jgi:hypothetical protein
MLLKANPGLGTAIGATVTFTAVGLMTQGLGAAYPRTLAKLSREKSADSITRDEIKAELNRQIEICRNRDFTQLNLPRQPQMSRQIVMSAMSRRTITGRFPIRVGPLCTRDEVVGP